MPTIKFDARGIASLKVEKRTDYFDESLPCFGIRVTEHNKKTWFIFYNINGRKRRYGIGTFPKVGLADARDAAKILFGEIAKGTDPAGKRDQLKKADTVSMLVEKFVASRSLVVQTHKDIERRLENHLVRHYGSRKVDSIRKPDILDVLDRVVAQGYKSEPNRLLKDLKQMFNWAIDHEIVSMNPCLNVKPPLREYPKDRVLTPDEILKLWKALDDEKNEQWFGTKKDKIKVIGIFKLMLILGQRGEIVRAMEWSEVDIQNSVWTIPKEKMKMNNPQRVFLPEIALKILRELKLVTGQGKYVFPSPTVSGEHIKNSQKAIERLRETTAFEFSAHDLRRTTASHMSSMGVPRVVVKKILGHIDRDVIATYDLYAYDFEKNKAWQLWAERLEKIISGNSNFSIKHDQRVWSEKQTS